jgi:hypothetical protein
MYREPLDLSLCPSQLRADRSGAPRPRAASLGPRGKPNLAVGRGLAGSDSRRSRTRERCKTGIDDIADAGALSVDVEESKKSRPSFGKP